jgi:preprotein translocase subunit SecD
MRRAAVVLAATLVVVGCSSPSPSVSMRQVLGIFEESPALDLPEGDRPPGIDSETGLTKVDDPAAEVYLVGIDSLVYYLAPAFVTDSDFVGAEVESMELVGTTWLVKPRFTSQGGEKLRQATMDLAAEPLDSPTRQIAVVFDGKVISAPTVAHDIDPSKGISPQNVVFVVGSDDGSKQLAERIAASLQK